MFSKITKLFGKSSSSSADSKIDGPVLPSDPKAQYELGYQYATGNGRPKDMVEGIKWIERAAEQNYSEALFHIGAMYHHGQGMPQDYTKAAEYYLAAAEQEHPKAQNNLATLHADGLGVAANLTQALKWFQKASENGHPSAKQNVWITKQKLQLEAENQEIISTNRGEQKIE